MPSFLSPWWGLLGLMALPIVALYLLRQKRPEHKVSSTLLWGQVLQDMRASTPFQKLRRHLLLILQLLILAALVFTRMRPVIQSQATRGDAGVIVLDSSASMQATDQFVGAGGGLPATGQTRLERAKAEANKLIDNMGRNDRFMILADGGGLSQVRSGFSADKGELHHLVDSVKPSDTSTDLSETILLAATSLRTIGTDAAHQNEALRAGKIFLFSDGAGVRLPNVPNLENLLNYVKIGESSSNVGVIRMAVEPMPKQDKTYQVFAGVANYGPVARSVAVGLSYQKPGNVVDAKRLSIPAHGQAAAIFQITRDPGLVYVRVEGPEDDLALDDTAYGILEPARKLRVVLVSRGNAVLERFLSTVSASPDSKIAASRIDPGEYKADIPADLMIFDNTVPNPVTALPHCDALFIRPPAGVAGFKVTGLLDHPPVLRWKREDPLLAYVELGELRISDALGLERDPSAVELISSPKGPLLLSMDEGSTRRYVLGFDPLTQSNWWMQPSLLIFLENLIEQTRVRHFIGLPQVIAAGQPAQLWDVGTTASVETPDGMVLDVPAKDGAAEFPNTDHVGFYAVKSGGRTGYFAVNLLSPTESDIAPKRLDLPAGGNVFESPGIARVNREIWPWVAAAGLAVLMLEWWVYHRRVG